MQARGGTRLEAQKIDADGAQGIGQAEGGEHTVGARGKDTVADEDLGVRIRADRENDTRGVVRVAECRAHARDGGFTVSLLGDELGDLGLHQL